MGARPGHRQPHRGACDDQPTSSGRRTALKVVPVATDVTDEDSRDNAARPDVLEAFGRVDCVINNAFGIPPMTRSPRSSWTPLAPRTRPTCSRRCDSRRCSRTPCRAGEAGGSIIMVNSCVSFSVAARVRRLQALQGRPQAPRLVAGHRARPARHPGEQRRAVVHLRGREPRLLRLPGAGSGRPTSRCTPRRPRRPTSSGSRRRRRSPVRRSSSPATWPRP